MWTKTIKVKYQGKLVSVQIWLDSDDGKGATVIMRSMLNEYFLEENIVFNNRDAAYAFVTYCPYELAKEFLIREAISIGAYSAA